MTSLQKFLAGLALIIALGVGGMIGAAGIGHKFGAWDFAFARQLLEWGVIGAMVVGGLSVLALLLGIFRGKLGGAFTALLAIAIAGGAAYVPWQMKTKAEALPAITDISTDTVEPPAFVALATERANFPKGNDYDASAAAKQKAAYPDIVTLTSRETPAALFGKTHAALEAAGLRIAASEPDQGRIEAASVSEWFGFKEDVVVRIVPDGEGAKLDIRSASRAGDTDFGANAERVRAILAAVK